MDAQEYFAQLNSVKLVAANKRTLEFQCALNRIDLVCQDSMSPVDTYEAVQRIITETKAEIERINQQCERDIESIQPINFVV